VSTSTSPTRSNGRSRVWISAAVITGLLSFACAHKAPEIVVAPEHRDFSGTWNLNTEKSDDPAQKLEELRAQMRSGRPGAEGGERPPGRMGGGRGGGRRPMGGGRSGGDGMQAGLGMALRASTRFTVRQDDSTVTFTSEDGTARVYHADGRKTTERLGPDREVKTRARWDGKDFVITRDLNGGMTVIESYFHAPDTNELYEIVELKASRLPEPVMFRRVYDPVTETPR
jgi:hypothetical protein